jgi:flagellar hook protein FlgE
MLRSLFSGISGLRQHQTMMDVVGNNISNVNTAGYKSSSTVFEDTLSQLVKAAGAPQNGQGGTNPAQVGLGVRLGAITNNFSQGAAQATGRSTDLMIQGDGFFAVRQGAETLYTRSGAFSFDADGWLVTSSGARVQGWTANAGVVDINQPVGDLQLPVGATVAPTATTQTDLGGNLPADATVYAAGPPSSGTRIVTSIKVYDGQGIEHNVLYAMEKAAAAGAWNVTASLDGAAAVAVRTVNFDPATGKLVDPVPGTPEQEPTTGTFAAPWGPITVELSGLTQYGGTNTVSALGQDGAAMGSLQAFTLSPDGTIVGVFSNGLKQSLGQVALAAFNNPPGLEKIGGSLYRTTVNSGNPQLGLAGGGGRGLLSSGQLEMSNVDLAQEFTNLIVAQRGFQANSRVITSSDEILQDLVNLKR